MNETSTGSPIGSPTTLVYADSLSEAAIVDAVRHGRTTVQLRGPDDPFVEMTMQTKDGGTAILGDEVDGIDHIAIGVHVVGGSGSFVQLWKDGVKVDQQAVTSDDFHATFDRDPSGQPERFRIQLISDTNQTIVITSHIYVLGVAPAGGCGCRTAGPGAAGGLALGLALVLARRRRRPKHVTARAS